MRSLRSLALISVPLLLLAGCARDVPLEPAPSASDPVCGEVLQTAPRVLAGADQRATTSQSSRAWGDPAITLRCGVEPLAPTTDRCITVTGQDGIAINWVVAENDEVVDTASSDEAAGDGGRGRFRFTTYGRIPAVEVIVPVEYAGSDATAILVDLGPAIARTDAPRTCW